MTTDNGRTHDPSLRELTSELDGLRDLLLAKIETVNSKMDERDKLYTERSASNLKAFETALQAAQNLNKTISEWSEKAIVKADLNADRWRANANEWRAAMDDREKKFAMRSEVEGKFKSVDDALAIVRQFTDQGVGGKAMKDETRANIAIILSFLGLLAAVVVALFKSGGK